MARVCRIFCLCLRALRQQMGGRFSCFCMAKASLLALQSSQPLRYKALRSTRDAILVR